VPPGQPLGKLLVAGLACVLVTACSDSGQTEGSGENGGNGENPIQNPDNTPDPITLPGLPSPPLSVAPAADDEPVAGSGDFHSITAFLPVRNPGPRIPQDEPVDVTLADYLAGPVEPVVQVPAGVDPLTNQPPYFEGLQDQEIVAGQTLTVLYKL